MEINLGEVIASRIIEETKKGINLKVMVGMPKPFPDSHDFFLPYQITGIGNEKIRFVGGVDAIQCLQLVMPVIGAELQRLKETYDLFFSWSGSEEGNIGFPS